MRTIAELQLEGDRLRELFLNQRFKDYAKLNGIQLESDVFFKAFEAGVCAELDWQELINFQKNNPTQ